MSYEKKVRFGKPYLPPKTIDVVEYQFPFTVVDSSLIGAPEEESETKQHSVKVVITGVLDAWDVEFSACHPLVSLYSLNEKLSGCYQELQEITCSSFIRGWSGWGNLRKVISACG